MKNLFEVALDLQDTLRRLKQRFAIIGGVALQRWGEPRVTQDVDVTVLVRLGQEATLT